MATIVRGNQDEIVERVRAVLDEYERLHPDAKATLYRQSPASVRVRIIDPRFSGRTAGMRHDDVWNFMVDRLNSDDIQDISMLLLLTPKELSKSFLNSEFEDPIPSGF